MVGSRLYAAVVVTVLIVVIVMVVIAKCPFPPYSIIPYSFSDIRNVVLVDIFLLCKSLNRMMVDVENETSSQDALVSSNIPSS